MSSTAGEFVTETLDYDGGRQVTAYVPAAAAEAVVFAGDGELIASWAGVLEAAGLPPTAIIGAHRLDDETLRLGEYSPGPFDPQRYPDIYGTVFAASPGAGHRPPPVLPGPLPHTYLVAGTQEPFFRRNATRWAEALRDAGADVVMTERAGSPGDAFWKEEFPLMVDWAFARFA
jgi:acetyl esterase/lipase